LSSSLTPSSFVLLASSRVVVTLATPEYNLPLDCFVVVTTEKVELCVPVPAQVREEESTNGGDRSPGGGGGRVEAFVEMLVRWFADQYNDLSWILMGREIVPALADSRSHRPFVMDNLDTVIWWALDELSDVYGSWYDANSYWAYDWPPFLNAVGLPNILERDYVVAFVPPPE
jgi:hypothetical protein